METDSIILIRHSQPVIRADIPYEEWELSEHGRQCCISLTERIRVYRPVEVVTSREKKAIQTGKILAQILAIPATIEPGLHEHVRDDLGNLSRIFIETKLKHFFEQPSRLVFGRETAEQALRRFSAAMTDVIDLHPTGSLAIVAHGTVISLWVTNIIGGDPFAFWKRLGLPAFVVFSRPNLEFLEFIEHVT
jgi:broad specificity phosphatase PhoE